jgi:murein DD-endopeptidase MepM/ murein hydrolase activator NlpD
VIRTVALLTATVLSGLAALGAAAGTSLSQTGGAWVAPVSGARISQPFGCTTFTAEPLAPHCPGGHTHTGVDLAVSAGTPVRAAATGVARVVRSATGYGLHVVVDHGGGVISIYGHLSVVVVPDSSVVGEGEVIGAVGSTGNSTGPHLHFELREGGVPVDPESLVILP